MHTTIHLQHSFSFGLLPVFLAFIAIVVLVVLFIASKSKEKRKDIKPAVAVPAAPVNTTPNIKDKYIQKVIEVDKDFSINNIDVREGYQRLSMLIREFSTEFSGVDITKKTLAEIRAMNKYQVERLLEDYYENEFSKDPQGNLKKSVEKTIEVIKTWS